MIKYFELATSLRSIFFTQLHRSCRIYEKLTALSLLSAISKNSFFFLNQILIRMKNLVNRKYYGSCFARFLRFFSSSNYLMKKISLIADDDNDHLRFFFCSFAIE